MDLSALTVALDALLLERLDDGRFVVCAAPPAWCSALRRRPPAAGSAFAVDDVFEFMSAFVPDAEHAWSGDGSPRVDSDFWTEVGVDGDEIHLEASAVSIDGQRALVIRRNEPLYRQQTLVLQRARELRLAHESLTREIETKDILVHAIVHDLAAPLHSILGALSLLAEQDAGEEIGELVTLALAAAVRQRELIAEILDVFAAEHGGAATAETGAHAPDAVAVAREVVAERTPSAARKDVTLVMQAALASARVEAESSRLFRVITNLVDNAIRHGGRGSRVEVVVTRDADAIEIAVLDEGPGVSPELLPQLFEKLPRGRDRRGTGLGLYFCRITAEAWGGGVGYEPRSPRGARFWVRLRPAVEVAAPEVRDGEAAPGR